MGSLHFKSTNSMHLSKGLDDCNLIIETCVFPSPALEKSKSRWTLSLKLSPNWSKCYGIPAGPAGVGWSWKEGVIDGHDTIVTKTIALQELTRYPYQNYDSFY